MNKIVEKNRDEIVAVLILILWSIGVVFFPGILVGHIEPQFLGITIFYLLLHVVIFLFAFSGIVPLIKAIFQKRKKVDVEHFFRTILYVYTLICLAVSFIVTIGVIVQSSSSN